MRLKIFEQMIMEGYREAVAEFSKDNPDAGEIVSKYRDLVNRNQVQGQERNIDYWRKQGFQKFKDFVTAKEKIPSNRQVKKSSDRGKSITLAENDEWLIVIPLDKDASCFYGKNTEWCTTKQFHSHYEQYFHDSEFTLIYFIQKKTMNKWAIAAHNIVEASYFDINDKPLEPSVFDTQTGLSSEKFIKLAKKNDPKIKDVRKQYSELKDQVAKEVKNTWERDLNLEAKLMKLSDPYIITTYMRQVGGKHKYPEKMVKVALNAGQRIIRHVENPSLSIMMLVAEQTPDDIEEISGNVPIQVYITASSRTSQALDILMNDVKPEDIPYEVYKNTVTNFPRTLEYYYSRTPEKYLPELRKIALEKSPTMASILPNLSKEEWIIAIENENKYSSGSTQLKKLPKELQNDNDILNAMLQSKAALEYIEEIEKYDVRLSEDQYMMLADTLKDSPRDFGKAAGIIMNFSSNPKRENMVEKMFKRVKYNED